VAKVPDGWAAYVVVGDARLFAGNYPTKQQAALGYNAVIESLVIAGAWLRVRWCLPHTCVRVRMSTGLVDPLMLCH
jgi:hypothetical protein